MGRSESSSGISRRAFLSGGAAVGGVVLAAPLTGPVARLPWVRLRASQRTGGGLRPEKGYGPLLPVADRTTGLPLLRLPRGFRYESYGWTGDIMDDGTLTPDRHDGMAVVDVVSNNPGSAGAELVLIRNHERDLVTGGGPVPLIGEGQAPVYDDLQVPGLLDGLGGGTTALTFSRGRFSGSQATLGGTLLNCAGGPTPWGSWLTCEEIVVRGAQVGAMDHGFVFEVPSPRLGRASAVPIEDMGLMSHEAVAVDPKTGDVYLTEDNGPASGLYRFRPSRRPRQPGDLEAGGTLAMLGVADSANADLRDVEQGQSFAVDWVHIATPTADPEGFASPGSGLPNVVGVGRSGPFLQGEAGGAATFSRLEGCWYDDGVVYVVDTNAGPVGKGIVWALELGAERQEGQARLTAVFVSEDEEVADNPDNITVSPRGGLLVCEDGGGLVVDGERRFGTRLVGINAAGESFVFAENNLVFDQPIDGKPDIAPDDYRGMEWAGATFSPTGRHLFVNIQTPGVTFAITGPWGRGTL